MEALSLNMRDAATGNIISTLADVPRPRTIAPDGQSFYAAPAGRIASVGRYDIHTGQRDAIFAMSSPPIQTVAWSSDGRWIAAASARDMIFTDEEANIVIWDTSTGQAVQSINVPGKFGTWLTPLDWSPNSRHLAIGHRGILIWDIEARQVIRRFAMANIYSLAWSPDGTTLAAGFNGGQAALFDAASGAHLYDVITGSSDDELEVTALVWSPDGAQLALGDTDGHLFTISAPTGELISTYSPSDSQEKPIGEIQNAAFSPDGNLLAAITTDGPGGTLLIWEVGNQQLITEAKDVLSKQIYSVGLTSLAWSRDSKRIALGNGSPFRRQFIDLWPEAVSNRVILWDVEASRIIDTLVGHTSAVQSVALSPDGTRLASGSLDGTVIIWKFVP
jgi:WD40 repeat protein